MLGVVFWRPIFMPVDEKLTDVFVSIRSSFACAVSGIVPLEEIEDIAFLFPSHVAITV